MFLLLETLSWTYNSSSHKILVNEINSHISVNVFWLSSFQQFSAKLNMNKNEAILKNHKKKVEFLIKEKKKEEKFLDNKRV